MQWVIPFNIMLLISLSTGTPTANAEPGKLGYERWASTGYISGVEFTRHPKSYYGTYANKLKLADDGKSSPPMAPYRLIDIEMTYDNAADEYLMDGVWVENKGNFKANSWMLYDLSQEDVKLIAQLENAVILDIEQHGVSWSKNGNPRYSLILKDNPNKFPTKVLLQKEWHEVVEEMYSASWRPVDIDILHQPNYDPALPDAWDNARYNVILVSNDYPNHVATIVQVDLPWEIEEQASKNLQLIDMEPFVACTNPVSSCPTRTDQPCENTCDYHWHYLSIYVANGLPYEFAAGMTSNESVAENDGLPLFEDEAEKLGRAVDIEGGYYNPYYNPLGRSGVFVTD